MADDRTKSQYAHMLANGAAEEIAFRPSGGEARTITAVVERHAAAMHLNAPAARMTITAMNDATEGIDAASLDCGKDQVQVAARGGGTAEWRYALEIVESDAETVTMAVG